MIDIIININFLIKLSLKINIFNIQPDKKTNKTKLKYFYI